MSKKTQVSITSCFQEKAGRFTANDGKEYNSFYVIPEGDFQDDGEVIEVRTEEGVITLHTSRVAYAYSSRDNDIPISSVGIQFPRLTRE